MRTSRQSGGPERAISRLERSTRRRVKAAAKKAKRSTARARRKVDKLVAKAGRKARLGVAAARKKIQEMKDTGEKTWTAVKEATKAGASEAVDTFKQEMS